MIVLALMLPLLPFLLSFSTVSRAQTCMNGDRLDLFVVDDTGSMEMITLDTSHESAYVLSVCLILFPSV